MRKRGRVEGVLIFFPFLQGLWLLSLFQLMNGREGKVIVRDKIYLMAFSGLCSWNHEDEYIPTTVLIKYSKYISTCNVNVYTYQEIRPLFAGDLFFPLGTGQSVIMSFLQTGWQTHEPYAGWVSRAGSLCMFPWSQVNTKLKGHKPCPREAQSKANR